MSVDKYLKPREQEETTSIGVVFFDPELQEDIEFDAEIYSINTPDYKRQTLDVSRKVMAGVVEKDDIEFAICAALTKSAAINGEGLPLDKAIDFYRRYPELVSYIDARISAGQVFIKPRVSGSSSTPSVKSGSTRQRQKTQK